MKRPKPSENLAFTLSGDETYYEVSGIGNCEEVNILIPEVHRGLPVKKIAAGAFQGNDSIQSVTLPACIDEIDPSAFDGCTALTDVHVTDLEAWCKMRFSAPVFSSLPSAKNFYLDHILLTDLVLPEGVERILPYVFANFGSIKNITLPTGVTAVDGYAFEGCCNLKCVTLPDTVACIDKDAFVGCPALEHITVGKNNLEYQSIDGNLYTKDGTTLLQYVGGKPGKDFTLPDGVLSIDSYAFRDCPHLVTVTFPAGVTELKENAFDTTANLIFYCEAIKPASLPESFNLRRYTNAIVWDCNNKSVDENGYAYTAEDGLLYQLKKHKATVYTSTRKDFLKAAHIPEVIVYNNRKYKVVAIAPKAFYGCTNLESLEIPKNLQTFDTDILSDFLLLNNITVHEKHKNYLSVDGNLYTKKKKTRTLIRYTSDKKKKTFAIPKGVAAIANNAFLRCPFLTSVTIPSTVTSIGKNAFVGCGGLTSVTFEKPTGWRLGETEVDFSEPEKAAAALLESPENGEFYTRPLK